MTLAAITSDISMTFTNLDIDLNTLHIERKLNVVAYTLFKLSINSNLASKLPKNVPNHIWVTPNSDAVTLD